MISLIVPVYNVRPFIEEFLNSVVNQTYKDFEAILVDDGSTDGSAEILDLYAQQHRFFRVIHKTNGGIVSAWKRGIYEAKGEYIAFADPDDILMPHMLEYQNQKITEFNADIVITGIKRLEGNKLSLMPADNHNLNEGLYECDSLEKIKSELFGSLKNHNDAFLFFRWNKLFKKEIILKNLVYSPDEVSFGEDVCISASVIFDSQRLYYSYEPLYVYRIRDNSLTTVKFNSKQIDNAEEVVESVFKMLRAKNRYEDFIFYNYTSYHICYLIKKIVGDGQKNSIKKQNINKLKNSSLVRLYSIKKAKKNISSNRFLAIRLLKSPLSNLLILLKDKM